jgi:hypothetical protein
MAWQPAPTSGSSSSIAGPYGGMCDRSCFNSLSPVISSDYKSTMSAQAAGFETAQLSFRKRRAGRFSSKLPNRPEPRSEPGFQRSRPGTDDTYSRAASGRSHTSRPGSMRGSSMPGSRAPGSTAPPTARIRCGERRRPKSTRRRATCEPSNCSSGIQSSKARFVTSGSRSTTRSASPSRSRCELRRRGRGSTGSGAATLQGRWNRRAPPTAVTADKTRRSSSFPT